ncbi:MAG: ABC transporter substrate-binding protein [Cellvibrionaceae bacterium]|nr:ABC transporter substrate-binding protein [Cellvibrionaceae bacterium]
MNRRLVVTSAVLLLSLLMSVFSVAETTLIDKTFSSQPHKVVQETTAKVLAAIKKGDLDPQKSPEIFVDKLSAILDPVVAFDRIARGVMGSHAKKVSKQQLASFSRAFKLGLVNTYGKGLSEFGDVEIVVLPPSQEVGDQKRVSVVQELRSANSINQVSYSMAKNARGDWKMINIVFNGINLGRTFQKQFAASVKKNDGDVVKTINEWGQG